MPGQYRRVAPPISGRGVRWGGLDIRHITAPGRDDHIINKHDRIGPAMAAAAAARRQLGGGGGSAGPGRAEEADGAVTRPSLSRR